MKKFFLRTILIISCVSLSSNQIGLAQAIDYRGFPEWSWGKHSATEYYIYTPASASTGRLLPIVLFLHGCCGTDERATLRNAVDPPVRLWHNFGENRQAVPAYILSPKTTQGWRQHFENIKAVIDSLVTSRHVDPKRIYISGFSMGAAGTWQFIEEYPGYFAAAIAMGMDFKGTDPVKFKDIPVWAIRGNQDWWARNLGKQVMTIRAQTIANVDSAEWHTGINPRLTNFEGMGHVVMWPAVNELELQSWLFSKINDGNSYPVAVIRRPGYLENFNEGDEVTISVEAFDPDGKIVKAELMLNGKLVATAAQPMDFKFKAPKGDNVFEVTVYDDKGKSATASGRIRVDIPVLIESNELPTTQAGKYVSHDLKAKGNGMIKWQLAENSILPEGLTLTPRGNLSGIPANARVHSFTVTATDDDGDSTTKIISLTTKRKSKTDVIVRNARNYKRIQLLLKKTMPGMAPHMREDNEVTLSQVPEAYRDLTLIQTDPLDTTSAKPFYMSFETDEPVTVYVAYETLNNPKSSIPPWLKSFRREKEEIVAQYFYYQVYSKDFPAGKINLPDAEEKQHGVNTNYFVMVKKK